MEAASSAETSPAVGAKPKTTKVSDVKVTNANEALNVLAGFVHLAQQRGCYSFEESSKIWEALRMLETTSAKEASASTN